VSLFTDVRLRRLARHSALALRVPQGESCSQSLMTLILDANNPEDIQPLSVDGEGRAAAGERSS
jgi:hypothetical protein